MTVISECDLIRPLRPIDFLLPQGDGTTNNTIQKGRPSPADYGRDRPQGDQTARKISDTERKRREVWAKHKDIIMAEALAAKYSQEGFSRTDLLATYPYFLVEASPHDEYWGANFSKEKIIKSGRLGNGKNQLGIMLTALRQLIKNEAITFMALTPNPSAQQLREAASARRR